MTTPSSSAVRDIEIKVSEEYARLVPELSQTDYSELKKSIAENGQYMPIIVNPQGVVLDGHHRVRIGHELGIEIKYVIKEFENKFYEQLFVIDSNLKRRHLNTFQRIELALQKKPLYEKIVKLNMSLGGKGDRNLTPLGRIDEAIAKDAGTSRDTVRKVEEILEKASDEAIKKVRKNDKIFKEYKKIQTSETQNNLANEKQKIDLPSGCQLYQGDCFIEGE